MRSAKSKSPSSTGNRNDGSALKLRNDSSMYKSPSKFPDFETEFYEIKESEEDLRLKEE
jgi:hypothetical protein